MPVLLSPRPPALPSDADGPAQRARQLATLLRLAEPVLTAGAENRLHDRFIQPDGTPHPFAPLEALGRTLAGIAPWLELGPGETDEDRARLRCIGLATRAIDQAVDPASPGFLNFHRGGGQPLVDTAFLAQALLRAPTRLWGGLSPSTRSHVVAALKSSRVIRPHENNWLLFSAMVETALLAFTGECDHAPVQKAVERHQEWYAGDGAYGDGPSYHWDYYNSFVIQPMLLEIVELCARLSQPPGEHLSVVRTRALRYAEVQERLISPEGTFPVVGRSSTYRFGAFQMLSLAALRRELPTSLSLGGVRCGLDAVIHRMIEAPGTFDDQGWLRIGVVGAQPAQAEPYISRGSIYLCTLGLLH
ncbi:MAG: DUF2264 domain-containing protein, partial [Burkholderiales bacterium]|nr:DUF2264 domain-containing protein [Opitutaceae bacterium]